jgi:hypothetical protein
MGLGVFPEIYRIFGPLFFELVGFYEYYFNREPSRIIDYEKVIKSEQILPISGKVTLPNYVMYLSQLPVVNRLTEIKQLAYTYVIFSGATHTRYEHSVGVMHRCSILLDRVKEIIDKKCEGKNIKITDDDKVVMNVAALLHDLGHPSWGHALDGITGYVIQSFREADICLFSPKKLDVVLTLYLLFENKQMVRALDICSREIKNKDLRKSFREVIAQIIMEEEPPLYFEEKDALVIKKIHLLTTILGRYGKRGGINADRLDWFIRDSHHANIKEKLDPQICEEFREFLRKAKDNKFDINTNNCEFLFIDPQFDKQMEKLREKIYAHIYEGEERAFIDSLLTRLAYTAINVIERVGKRIASAPVVTSAVTGYLLMHDYLLKEYTNKVLCLAKEHSALLGRYEYEPDIRFISKSAELLNLLDYINLILHSLSSSPRKNVYSPHLHLNFDYIEFEGINKVIITITSANFAHLIERAWEFFKEEWKRKIPEESILALLFQSVITARINSIVALGIPSLESKLESDVGGTNICLLVNYYFFRKLDDCFKQRISDLEGFYGTLKGEELGSKPIMFILTNETKTETLRKICEILCDNLIMHFHTYFRETLLKGFS